MPKPESYQARGKTVYKFRIIRSDNGKRTTIRLHDATEKYAVEAGDQLDILIQANRFQTDLPPRTTLWLSEVPERFYERLVSAGLIEPRTEKSSVKLDEFLDGYVALKSADGSYKGEWSKSTTTKRKQSVKDLVQYFGGNKDIRDVSVQDGQKWKNWLLGEKSRNLSPASTSKKIKDARQFFEHAIDLDLIERNPFAKVKLPPQDNPDRMRYVSATEVNAVLDVITDPEFRLTIALARFAGFRTPSEAQQLRWNDVDRASKIMLVQSPKLRQNSTRGRRTCPIFPQLVPYFDALPAPTNRQQLVLPGLRSQNLRTQFCRYVVEAGLTPWPKLFHNLRASALTDLVDVHSLPSVCKWLGTSPKIAMKHYFMLRGRELSDPDDQENNR
ncbi:tyrosine-type recombinase/integrase [Rhodopirellula europaea]|uniref:Integrase family protein n=1 Tax=Rhodopirellula europaea SH398 TaxID=1263868 RepID=M5S142_9BACT|nr:phage integrase SAM-like domain-containing protein [Rhodopirellula europaea]EMI25186.1 integrase family protein [Rhodopirellula europaea SH398]